MITTISKSKITKISIYVNRDRKSMAQVKKELGCSHILNGGLFDMAKFTPAGYLTVGGQVLAQVANPYGFAMSGTKIVFSYGNNVKYPDFLGCYHVLVRDGKIAMDKKTSAQYGTTARSCMGLTASGDVVMLCVQYGINLMAAAQQMLQAGCVVALNYDGGGSSQGNFDGQKQTSSRVVHNYVCIWTEREETTLDKQYTVCVDPGHSATEAQGSPDGTYKEHEFALDVGQRLRGHLERHDVKVVMTRQTGASVSLSERCRISNAAECDYFVSVHTNAAPDPGWQLPNGFETVICGKGGKAEQLAAKLQKEVPAALGCATRPMKINTKLAVLNGTACPAVICEYGFHTNQKEVEKLKDTAYREACATATAKGVLQQLGIAWKAPTTTPQPPAWYDEHCKWVSDMGIADGKRPGEAMTRAEAFAMVHRLVEIVGIGKL